MRVKVDTLRRLSDSLHFQRRDNGEPPASGSLPFLN